jgi:hypothetical protein
MPKYRFTAHIDWDEEMEAEDLRGIFYDSTDDAADLKAALRDWLSDRKRAITNDLKNIPDDASVVIEVDEIGQ